MLAFLESLPFVGPIINNIKMVAICAAVVIITNGGTALVFYVKGHNAAAAQCKIGSLIRERDEARRDRDVAVSTSTTIKAQLDAINARQAEREQKDAEDASKLKPIVGCTVPPLAPRRLRR